MASREALYAGYYIERGFSADAKPEYLRTNAELIMDAGRHWHLFVNVMKNQSQREHLNKLMENLPVARSCISLLRRDQISRPIHYDGQNSLNEMESALSAADADEWIDLVLGVSFQLDECLDLQEGIVEELRTP